MLMTTAEPMTVTNDDADESPGTPMGRINAIGQFAEDRGLCSGVEAKPAEVFLMEAFDALRAELAAAREAYSTMRELVLRARIIIDTINYRDWDDAASAALQRSQAFRSF
jgi:hypothetical protein